MQIFGVVVNPDDTVRVIARDVVKETPQFYFMARPAADLPCGAGALHGAASAPEGRCAGCCRASHEADRVSKRTADA
jgi:hypothetical protein